MKYKEQSSTIEERLWEKLVNSEDIRDISIILDSLLMLKELEK